MFLHAACSEVLQVLPNHFALNLIGGVLLSLLQTGVDFLQEGRKLSELQSDYKPVLLNNFLFGFNGCDSDGVVSVRLLGESVIFGHDALLNKEALDLFSVGTGDVAGVVAAGPVFVGEGNQTQRGFVGEQQFADFVVNFVKLLGMGGPVGSGKIEGFEGLLRAFRDEFGVSKRFVVACVVKECRQVDEDLLEGKLVNCSLNSVKGGGYSSLEGF